MDGLENEQGQGLAPEPQAPAEPVDLAQAFKMLNQIERGSAEEPVAKAEPPAEPGPAAEPAGPVDPGEPADAGAGVQAPADAGIGGGGGGPAVGIEAIDFDSRKQAMLQGIQKQAVGDVRREFQDKNIGYYSMNELRVQDERTGQVRFRNPDVAKDDERNPKYYFDSRKEAQDFIDSWNKDVDAEFRKAVNAKQRELLNDMAPRIRLIDFAPKFYAMDEMTRNVFEKLVAPYAIKDKATGEEIGYNVDLNQMAAVARGIVSDFRKQAPTQEPKQQQQQRQQQQGSGPAMDMKSGNGTNHDAAEPKTLGEAIKMIDERNRSKRNG